MPITPGGGGKLASPGAILIPPTFDNRGSITAATNLFLSFCVLFFGEKKNCVVGGER